MKYLKYALAALVAAFSVAICAQEGRPCQADEQKYCSQATGDNQKRECLLDHQQDVSDACYDAMKKRMNAQEGNQGGGQGRLQSCRADVRQFCSGVERGGGRIVNCLNDHKNELSDACYGALTRKPTKSEQNSQPAPACPDCGTVLGVKASETQGKGGMLGTIGGGVAGAVLGHQVGRGVGNTLMTVAGAAGGAYAGNKIQEKVTSSKSWMVRVRLDGGDERSFKFDNDPGFVANDLVRLSGESIVRR